MPYSRAGRTRKRKASKQNTNSQQEAAIDIAIRKRENVSANNDDTRKCEGVKHDTSRPDTAISGDHKSSSIISVDDDIDLLLDDDDLREEHDIAQNTVQDDGGANANEDETRPAQCDDRVYLKVPYQEKEEAKSNFNCQWDPDVAHWYVLRKDSEAALRQFGPATIAQIRAGREQTKQKRRRREATSLILDNLTTPPRTPPKPMRTPRPSSVRPTLRDVQTFLKVAPIEDVLKAWKLIK